jgi:beta-galactosidase GanA
MHVALKPTYPAIVRQPASEKEKIMYKALTGAVVAIGVVGTVLATQVPGHAQGGSGIQLDAGNVAFGYRDGYWDRGHHWHLWRNYAEARSYRHAQGSQYNNWNHDLDNDQGWHGLALNVGDVAFGYRDGYWDRSHQWHQWRNDQEMRDYRNAHANQYNDYRHDRDHDQGWRQ